MSQDLAGQPNIRFGLFDWIEQYDHPDSETYEQRLKMLEYADRAGFYSYHLAEHHITPLSIAPSPGIFLAAACQRTKNIRLGPLVYLLPFYNPFRLLHEICMLDHLSQGRLDLGIGRGIVPMEAERYGFALEKDGREMFQEALDVLIKGFTQESLTYEGKYYQYQETRLLMHPFQKPYPPFWYASNNIETIPWIARHGFNTCTVFSPSSAVKPHVDLYKQTWKEHEADDGRLNDHVKHPLVGLARHLYVGPNDKDAIADARSAYDVWFSNINHLWEQAGDRHLEPLRNFDGLLERGAIIAGSVPSVLEQVRETIDESGVNYFCPIFAFGNLTHEQTMKSMELFVNEIMPHFQ